MTYEPGIHDIPDEVYHRLPLCSKHALDVLADKSPAHLKYQRENPEPASEAMRFGSAYHTALLEPDHFATRHPVIGQCAAVTNGGKGARCSNSGKAMIESEWFCGTHLKGNAALATEVAGAITGDEYEVINRMADVMRRHTAAASVLNAPGRNEVAVIWDKRVEGDDWTHDVRCKLKTDLWRGDLLADLKTCESASPTAVAKAIFDFGYERQGAMYQDGFAAHGVKVEHFTFLFQEKRAPYAVATYRILDECLQIGREQNEKLIRVYAQCERMNHWWSYPSEFQDITLTRWGMQRRMAELSA